MLHHPAVPPCLMWPLKPGAQGASANQSLWCIYLRSVSNLQMLLWTINRPPQTQRHLASSLQGNAPVYEVFDIQLSILTGRAFALFQMMNLHCIVPVLSLPGRLGHPPSFVSTVLQSSQWSSTWPLVPRRRRACACSAWQTRLPGGCICNLTAPWPWNIRNELSV